MKKVLTLVLALLTLTSAPLSSIAYAEQIHTFDGVNINIPADLDLLEKAFREFVKQASQYYFSGADAGKSFVHSRYYYEAADFKGEFDSDVNIWGDVNDKLAYNTNEQVSDRDYKQETKEIVMYMLTQDVQNKADELDELSPTEKAAFYPGMMIDPNTGEITVNEQAVLAQEEYNLSVEQKIEEELVNVQMIFYDTLIDTGLGLSGQAGGMAYDITGAITTAVKNVWQASVALEYEEQQKLLKDAYREAMKQDVIAAQKNVDTQMFEGLKSLYEQMRDKGARGTDEQILMESLQQLLNAIEDSQSAKTILSKSVGGTTIDAEIDRIADALVNGVGMTPQEFRTSKEIQLELMECMLTESLLGVLDVSVSYVLENCDSSGKAAEMRDILIETVVSAVSEGFRDARKNYLDDPGVSTEDIVLKYGIKIANDIGSGIISALGETQFKTYWETMAQNAEGVLASKSLDYDTLKRKYDKMPKTRSQRKNSKYTTKYDETLAARKQFALEERQQAEKNLDNKRKTLQEWDEKKKGDFFSALIDNCFSLVESTFNMAHNAASLGNMGDNEVAISYVASAMYRARELAEEARDYVDDTYSKLVSAVEIDRADLNVLKDFVESMYVVLNTDMLGHTYYLNLCAWHEYQQDPNEAERLYAEKQELLDAKYEAAWDKGFGWGIGYTIFSPVYGGAGNVAVWISMGDSEYLKLVNKKSCLGSWISSDTAVGLYNSLSDIVDTKFLIPAIYNPLF